MAVTTTKTLDLVLLKEQLTAAGIAVNTLGTSGLLVHTYNTDGAITDLPPSAQAVVDTHDYKQGTSYRQAQDDQSALDGFPTRTQVTNALSQIDADLVTLGGAITLAQAGPILRRTVQNQRAIIRALNVLVHRGQ